MYGLHLVTREIALDGQIGEAHAPPRSDRVQDGPLLIRLALGLDLALRNSNR